MEIIRRPLGGTRHPLGDLGGVGRGRKRSRASRGVLFVVLLGLCGVLTIFSSTPPISDLRLALAIALRPLEGAVSSVVGAVNSVAATISDVDRVRTDNARLRDENAGLAAANKQLEEMRRENEQLTALLQLQNGFHYNTVAAGVIAAESSRSRRTIAIGKGTSDDIAVGNIVIARGGALVGRVVDVARTSANVRLITDADSIVIGQLPSAATGDVVGDLGGVLVMSRVDATETVHVGDPVVTAGIQLPNGARSAYPKGLVIGEVVDVKRDPNAVVQTAWLTPAAPVDRLEWVLVITNYEGLLPTPKPQ
jgi:rod shape-determining protein MreC